MDLQVMVLVGILDHFLFGWKMFLTTHCFMIQFGVLHVVARSSIVLHRVVNFHVVKYYSQDVADIIQLRTPI